MKCFIMMNGPKTTTRTLEDLSRDLAALAREGSPAIASLAQWVLERPQEIAFNSVRGLAELADVNVNTAYRLSIALGFSGYDECRRVFQSALRQSKGLYGGRAEQLSGQGGGSLIDDLRSAAHANLDEALTGENVDKIKDAAERLLKARRIYCVGVQELFFTGPLPRLHGRHGVPELRASFGRNQAASADTLASRGSGRCRDLNHLLVVLSGGSARL
jgi:hypothetical protein